MRRMQRKLAAFEWLHEHELAERVTGTGGLREGGGVVAGGDYPHQVAPAGAATGSPSSSSSFSASPSPPQSQPLALPSRKQLLHSIRADVALLLHTNDAMRQVETSPASSNAEAEMDRVMVWWCGQAGSAVVTSGPLQPSPLSGQIETEREGVRERGGGRKKEAEKQRERERE